MAGSEVEERSEQERSRKAKEAFAAARNATDEARIRYYAARKEDLAESRRAYDLALHRQLEAEDAAEAAQGAAEAATDEAIFSRGTPRRRKQ